MVEAGLPDDLFAIRDRILAFLRSDDYVAVQEAVIYLETIENKLRPDALANFRDVLDHLVRASKSTSISEAEGHLTEAQEHLRRAMSDPYQEAIADKLSVLDRTANWYYIRAVIFSDVPSERDFLKRFESIQRRIVEPRLLKGDRTRTAEAAQQFRGIFDDLMTFEDDIRPSRRGAAARVVLWVALIIVASVISVIVTLAVTSDDSHPSPGPPTIVSTVVTSPAP